MKKSKRTVECYVLFTFIVSFNECIISYYRLNSQLAFNSHLEANMIKSIIEKETKMHNPITQK